MRFIWDFIRYVIYLCLLLLLGAGLYAGNTAYNQLFSAPWDKILGMENHRDDLDQVHRAEARYGWEQVVITQGRHQAPGTYMKTIPRATGQSSCSTACSRTGPCAWATPPFTVTWATTC